MKKQGFDPTTLPLAHRDYRFDAGVVRVRSNNVAAALHRLRRQTDRARIAGILKARALNPSPRARKRAKRILAAKRAVLGGRRR